jgi:hypothetical protein
VQNAYDSYRQSAARSGTVSFNNPRVMSVKQGQQLMTPTSKLRWPATGAKKPEPEHVLEVPDDRDESQGP